MQTRVDGDETGAKQPEAKIARMNFDWAASLKEGARCAMLMVAYALLAVGQCLGKVQDIRREQTRAQTRKEAAHIALRRMLGADDLRIDLGPFSDVKLDDDSLLRRLQVVTRCLRDEGLIRALSSCAQLRAAGVAAGAAAASERAAVAGGRTALNLERAGGSSDAAPPPDDSSSLEGVLHSGWLADKYREHERLLAAQLGPATASSGNKELKLHENDLSILKSGARSTSSPDRAYVATSRSRKPRRSSSLTGGPDCTIASTSLVAQSRSSPAPPAAACGTNRDAGRATAGSWCPDSSRTLSAGQRRTLE